VSSGEKGPSLINVSETGLSLIKRWEGLRLIGYLCPAGVPTIGYGTTGPGIKVGMKITEEKAEEYLIQKTNIIAQYISNNKKKPLNQNEFDALVSFAYNVGQYAFSNSTLWRLVNSKASREEAAKQFKRWVKVDNNVVPGLVKRRESEHDLFLTPFTSDGMSSYIRALQDTWLKREPKSSTELPPEKKVFVPKGSAHPYEKIEVRSGQTHFVYFPAHTDTDPGFWFFPPHFCIDGIENCEHVIDNEMLDVPYYSQRDNQRDPGRTCFSSTCAMLLSYLKPGIISGDDQYIKTVFEYGDTTNPNVQVKALKEYGVTAEFRQDGNFSDVTNLIKSGIPVPMGILHNGNWASPQGGHWFIARGNYENHQGHVCHDPGGELDMKNGGFLNWNGESVRYPHKYLKTRWMPEGAGSGWYIKALHW
jgi:GH24 family phage-related lysozyme (muramidase)